MLRTENQGFQCRKDLGLPAHVGFLLERQVRRGQKAHHHALPAEGGEVELGPIYPLKIDAYVAALYACIEL